MLLEASSWGTKEGVIIPLGGIVDSWPLSVHNALCVWTMEERERHTEGEEEKRERLYQCLLGA